MSNDKALWDSAKESTEEVSKRTGFVKYKNTPPDSVFSALYNQIFKLAEISAFSELKKVDQKKML